MLPFVPGKTMMKIEHFSVSTYELQNINQELAARNVPAENVISICKSGQLPTTKVVGLHLTL